MVQHHAWSSVIARLTVFRVCVGRFRSQRHDRVGGIEKSCTTRGNRGMVASGSKGIELTYVGKPQRDSKIEIYLFKKQNSNKFTELTLQHE